MPSTMHSVGVNYYYWGNIWSRADIRRWLGKGLYSGNLWVLGILEKKEKETIVSHIVPTSPIVLLPDLMLLCGSWRNAPSSDPQTGLHEEEWQWSNLCSLTAEGYNGSQGSLFLSLRLIFPFYLYSHQTNFKIFSVFCFEGLFQKQCDILPGWI